ncbi:MAG: hypothetical protein RL375_13 [Pseudomonadota bacterium]
MPETDAARADRRAAAPWRRRAWWSLITAVALTHLWLGDRLSAEFISLADSARPAMQRMQASYTRVLEQSEPAPAPARPLRQRSQAPGAAVAAPVAPPASEAVRQNADDTAVGAGTPPDAASDASTPTPAVASAASATPGLATGRADPTATATSSPDTAGTAAGGTGDPASPAGPPGGPGQPDAASAVARPQAPASSPAAPLASGGATLAAASAPSGRASAATRGETQNLDGVDWPASTRLSYDLRGWYRGDVTGSARVEWLREGRRYQVHLEVVLGPSLTPLARRRMSSEGRISADGLVPQRYEQETWQIIGRTRRADMVLGNEMVTLANGQRQPRPPDVQDTASQFVQMVFLLMTRPELSRPGASVDFALALPHRIDRWTYDMIGTETLVTPAGSLATLHVRPRRRAAEGDLTVQMWLAPSLQMLPARIRIEQDASVWADLLLSRSPEQAAR